MKRPAAVFILLFFVLGINAQKVQIIVPKQVVAGNAFQVQYVIADPSAFETITAPQFDNLQLVSGPNYYKGNSSVNGKPQAIENIAYTVVPLKAGTVKIGPATIKFKNGEEKTDAVIINVIPQPKASFNTRSTYTDISLYAPSSKTDLDKLIDENLFIKTEVDRRTCFLGEVITASFKLYSRLQSTSEVINAPSLYGFSVMDMLNINEAHQSVETINGKVFNTSVLRKLQLYPAQTGQLTIDPMQLQNTIEFDDSSTGKKIKVEKVLASAPVTIVVKPLPPKQPANFTGAVGRFAISSGFQNTRIAANAQGKLVVIVSGKGNFIQLGTPVVNWPKGFDVFEPIVSEELDKNVLPTEGKATYVFSFTTDRIGHYVIPPVSFSFFEPSSGKYKTLTSDSLQFEIVPASRTGNKIFGRGKAGLSSGWIYLIVIGTILATASFIVLRKRKLKSVPPAVVTKPNRLDELNQIASQQLTDKEFCSKLQTLLNEVRKECGLSEQQNTELQSIKSDCQLLVYSDINSTGKKEELRLRAEKLIRQL
jgi:hypothetical protein